MSIIDLPIRPRRPGLTRTEPASVVKHPSVPHDFAAAAVEKMRADAERREAEMEADRQLSVVFREIEMVVLKAEALAKIHGREAQVMHMFEAAASRVRTALKQS